MDPLDQWEQRQQTKGQPKMSPRARELAAKNRHRMTAGRESSSNQGAGMFRVIAASILILPFTGSCGALLGAMVTGGSTAGIVVGVIVMVLVPIPFAMARYERQQAAKAAKRQFAAEKHEIHRHNLRRARGQDSSR